MRRKAAAADAVRRGSQAPSPKAVTVSRQVRRAMTRELEKGVLVSDKKGTRRYITEPLPAE